MIFSVKVEIFLFFFTSTLFSRKLECGMWKYSFWDSSHSFQNKSYDRKIVNCGYIQTTIRTHLISLDSLADVLDFFSSSYDELKAMDGFNMQLVDTVLKCFLDINGFINLIKNKTCFKGQGSCIDLILTNRKYLFKNSSSHETGVSDHQHLLKVIQLYS